MRKYHCLLFYCLLFAAYNFALSANPAEGSGEPAHSLTTVESRREALAELVAERARLEAGDVVRFVELSNQITELHLLLRDLDSALSNANESLVSARQLSPSTNGNLLVDTLGLSALVHLRRNDFDSTFNPLAEALQLSRNLAYQRGEARTLHYYAEVYFNKGKYGDGVKHSNDALQIWRELRDQRGEALTLLIQGENYIVKDEPENANTALREAATIWRQLGSPVELATTLLNLNFLAIRQGQWENALAFLNEAQALVTDKEAEPYLAGQIAMSFGEVHEAYGQRQTALNYFRESLTYYDTRAHDVSATVDASNKVGRVLASLEQFTEAKQQIEQGLSAAKRIQRKLLIGFCHEALGRVWLAAESYEQARLEFQLALNYLDSVNDQRAWARVQTYLGQTEYLLGNQAQAKAAYEKALNFFSKNSDYTNEAALSFGMGKLALDQNNLKEADKYLERSIQLTERLRENASSKDLRSSFLDSVHDRYETHVELLMARHKKQPDKRFDIQALEASELGRARALLDSLRNYHRELRQPKDPLLLFEEKRLQDEEQALVDQRAQLVSEGNAQRAKEVDSKLADVRARYESLQARINSNAKFIDLMRPKPLRYEDIRDQITDSGTSLVEYSLGSQRSFVWVVTRDGITHQELADKKTIKNAADQLIDLLKKPASGGDQEKQLQNAIAEVSRLVLQPISSQLRTSRLIIVADGILHYVPFQVLSLSANATEPMIARFDIVNAPSASTLAIVKQQRTDRQPGSRLLIGFGDPIFSAASSSPPGTTVETTRSNAVRDPTKLPRLFFSKSELHAIRDLAPDATEIYEDHAASRHNLLNADLSNFRILHMVTHGMLDDRQSELSGLMLSLVDANQKRMDGFVGLADIYKLRAPLDLVVLSACHSAFGANVRGEGLIGLTRGFMYAGASSVVASLWKVDDRVGSELMKHFYTNMLQNNMSAPSALRDAQNKIRQNPSWRSPYYWAGFTFQGDHQLRITKPPGPKRDYQPFIAVGFLAVAMSGLTYWYLRRRRSI